MFHADFLQLVSQVEDHAAWDLMHVRLLVILDRRTNRQALAISDRGELICRFGQTRLVDDAAVAKRADIAREVEHPKDETSLWPAVASLYARNETRA